MFRTCCRLLAKISLSHLSKPDRIRELRFVYDLGELALPVVLKVGWSLYASDDYSSQNPSPSSCVHGEDLFCPSTWALHIAAAFEIAGCPQVIATMWRMPDKEGSATTVARHLYKNISMNDGKFCIQTRIHALHSAIQRLMADNTNGTRFY